MSTLPPSNVKQFPEDSLEKLVYTMVDSLEENIPLMNDRNRLAFALLNFLRGQGDPPNITVRNNKLTLNNITKEKLSVLLDSKLAEIKK
jgi:hypothetical protein